MDTEPPSEQNHISSYIPFVSAFGFVLLLLPFWQITIHWCLLLLFIVVSAFLSGSEVAFFSLTMSDLDHFNHQESSSAKAIIRLKQKPKLLLATILIANNFVNIAIVILFDFLLQNTFSNGFFALASSLLHSWLPISLEHAHRIVAFVITVVIATGVLVLFGEILPKIYAKIHNRSLSLRTSRFLLVLTKILSPIASPLVRSSSFLEQRLAKMNMLGEVTSRDQISKAIDLTVNTEQDVIHPQEFNILKRIVNFGDVTVKEIMKSRVDVVAINLACSYEEVKQTIRESGYSRFPVYEDDFDSVLGLLYTKDLLIHHNKADFHWQDVVRKEVKYVPENKRISELIKEMQLERKHLVVVVDEFGGSSGIVTLEDIMEEVIGDIKDEFDDDDEIDYQKIDDKTFIFDGKTHLKNVCTILHVPRETFDSYKGDSDSVAGLMLELFGRFPKKNTEIKLLNFTFKIIAVNNRRIEKVQIHNN